MANGKKTSSISSLDNWEAEEDLRTLMRAKEIEKDSKRMKAAQELAKKKMLEVAAVASDTDTDD